MEIRRRGKFVLLKRFDRLPKMKRSIIGEKNNWSALHIKTFRKPPRSWRTDFGSGKLGTWRGSGISDYNTRRSNLQHTPELVESMTHAGRLLALIISGRFRKPGIHFFTPADFFPQTAYIEHPAGQLI